MEVLEKAYVSSAYGNRNGKIHNGVDLLSRASNTKIYCPAKAKVLKVINDFPDNQHFDKAHGGNELWLEHGDGYITRYCHLKYNSITVKYGDIVEEGTVIAEEGESGYAFGVHLHFEVWKGGNYKYVDPTNYGLGKAQLPGYKEESQEDGFLGSKGYFSLGDTHENIGKIAEFMYRVFPAYTDKKALGNYYGPYIQASIKEFQRRTHAEGKYNAEIDGNVGPITLNLLKQYGFHE